MSLTSEQKRREVEGALESLSLLFPNCRLTFVARPCEGEATLVTDDEPVEVARLLLRRTRPKEAAALPPAVDHYAIVRALDEMERKVTPWEATFLASIRDLEGKGRFLSLRQKEVIEGLAEKYKV